MIQVFLWRFILSISTRHVRCQLFSGFLSADIYPILIVISSFNFFFGVNVDTLRMCTHYLISISRSSFWSRLILDVLLIDVVEQNCARSNISFVFWVYFNSSIRPRSLPILHSLTELFNVELIVCGFFRNQCVFVGISFDVIKHFLVSCVNIIFIGWSESRILLELI